MCKPNCSMRTRYWKKGNEKRKERARKILASPEGTEEGMVAVNVFSPSEVKVKGLKVAPHSAIYEGNIFLQARRVNI